jgi:hypothetical protein
MPGITRRGALGWTGAGAMALLADGKAAGAAPSPGASSGYNPVWRTQSRNALESMPCGGGDVGLNVWVEDGDILFYLSRSGAFDETNAYLKLGRIRLRLDPNPFAAGQPFRQELKLEQGHVEIEGGSGEALVLVTLWVDVFEPVVHVEVDGAAPTQLTATYESWRTADRDYLPAESSMHRSYEEAPVTPVAYADRTAFAGSDVVSFHRNRNGNSVFDMLVAQQHLDGVKDRLWNPLHDLTFGLLLRGRGLMPAGEVKGRYASTDFTGWQLRSRRAAKTHDLRAYLHIDQAPNQSDWLAGARALAAEDLKRGTKARQATRKWWADFWQRSWIRIDPGAGETSQAWRIGRNYQLFRYQLGTNAYGRYPTKFNGGNFTVDPQFVDAKYPLSPDYRAWGGGIFTAQNQRLVYWPMLKSGDADMMESQFAFYQRALPNAEARTEVYWNHKGASFTEQIENFGLPCAFEYGWTRRWNQAGSTDIGVDDSAYVDRLWETSLEFCLMVLEVHRFTGADIGKHLDLVESCLIFFDQHFRRQAKLMRGQELDDQGHLIFFPGTVLETYKNSSNSVVTIAALDCVLRHLLALPDRYLTPAKRDYYRGFLATIPPIPMRTMQGHRTIAPALLWERIQNVEIPQLYPVFPYDQYGIGRPDLQTAIDTWRYGVDTDKQKNFISWHQDAIFCARLGLTDEAKAITIRKLDDSGRRYPTFWGPGHDWVPDHNWGGSGMIGLQEMLLQTPDDRLFLFPAWPRDWDVDFRLHAPGNTIVEARLRAGRIEALTVTPASRRAQVILPDWANNSKA